mgnify:CR=1 FL=1
MKVRYIAEITATVKDDKEARAFVKKAQAVWDSKLAKALAGIPPDTAWKVTAIEILEK